MYQFTNEQRRCFGLDLVRSDWSLIQLKTSRFDRHEAYAYLDGRTVKKCIFVSERQYLEYDYGEYEIIGNIPVTDNEDYPYAYCRSSDAREWHLKKILFQNGRDLLTLEGADPVPETDFLSGYLDGGPFDRVSLDLLRQCIEADSVAPYWNTRGKWDLRNPKNADALRAIRRQFGLEFS